MRARRPPVTDDGAAAGLQADDRGQTLNDLVIGIGLFIIAATFVLAFVPDLVAPFYEPGDRGEKIKAERSADLLAEDLLQHENYNGSTAVVNRSCVDAFFDGNDAHVCPYEHGSSYEDALALDDLSEVNVTMTSMDGSYDRSAGPDRTGESPAVWSRIVLMDGRQYRLTVYVW
jgi:hypothetical protein